MNLLLNENDIKHSFQGRKVYFIFKPPRKQFYIESIKRIMQVSEESCLDFTCVVVPPVTPILLSKRSRIEREVFGNSVTLLKQLEGEKKKFRLKIGDFHFAPLSLLDIFLHPNKNINTSTELYNSVLSIALSKQWIPEYAKKLPRFRFYKLKIQSALQWQLSQRIAIDCVKITENPIVIFLNGRLPDQAAIRKFCETKNLDFLVLEQGNPKNVRFHLQPFQPQETEASRNLNAVKLSRLVENENEKRIATSWSAEWISNQKLSSHNKFALWDGPFEKYRQRRAKRDFDANSKLISFFNSSLEERFTNLGMEMNGWANQSEALSLAMKVSKEAGYKTVLRFHPNYLRKNLYNIFYLIAVTRDYADIVFFPWDGASTPQLIQDSDIVVTWGSTVSLESTFRGIPTVLLGRTTYDNLIDVSIHNPTSISGLFDSLIYPDPSKTVNALYIAKNVGFPLDSSLSSKPLYRKRNKPRISLYLHSVREVLIRGLNATPQDFIIMFRPIFGSAITVRVLKAITVVYSIVFEIKKRSFRS